MRLSWLYTKFKALVTAYAMANIRRAVRTGNWNKAFYEGPILKAVMENECRLAGIELSQHPDFRKLGFQVDDDPYLHHIQQRMIMPLTEEQKLNLVMVREKRPVSARLEVLMNRDYEAYKAWRTLFSEDKLAETMMSHGEFEIMNEVFRRDLRDIQRQQMSHSQYVHDIVKAVDPVDVGVAAGTAISGGLMAPAALPYAGATLGIWSGKVKHDLEMDRYNRFGTNDPGEWTFGRAIRAGVTGAATAKFDPDISIATGVGLNIITDMLGSSDDDSRGYFSQSLEDMGITK